MSEFYSTAGPICPHCQHQHRADEAIYYDESLTRLDCDHCDREFNVCVYTQTSWTTEAKDAPA